MPANDKRPVKVNRRSGFDKHYRNTLTGTCGTLVPILVDEVIPDTKVNLKINVATALPPLVSDTYMNVRLRVEAFAVPHRLCYANFEDFFCDYPKDIINDFSYDSGAPADCEFVHSDLSGCVPLICIDNNPLTDVVGRFDYCNKYLQRGTLLDYLGYNVPPANPDVEGSVDNVNVMPLVAYHLIWQEWYRQPRVQKPAFSPLGIDGFTSLYNEVGYRYNVPTLPYTRMYYNGVNQSVIVGDNGDGYFMPAFYDCADGVSIFGLRQRNFGLDYFTAAMVEPQQGPQAKVAISTEGGVDSFTISSLRAQNSIQQFRERNNLTSPRYQQQIYARYGCAPSDGVIQRPILLGAATYDVYSHGVTQTAGAYDEGVSKNPFNLYLGARGGNAFASGSDFIIKGFHTKEPMYIIVLASLVPEVSYSQNMNPIWHRYIGKGSISDMANGILQNVGPQPILKRELVAESLSDDVFAYTDRYSDWMFKPNEIHGEFKENFGGSDGTISNFVLQRSFDSEDVEFGSEFLQIPTDYLDGVMQVTTAAMGFTFWMDCLLEYSVSMPLQEYAIPSLQDPGYEHGKTIVLRKNGQLL